MSNERVIEYQKTKDERLLNSLLVDYTPLVYRVFYRHYSRFQYDIEHFVSHGMQSLWRAICEWNQEKQDFLPFAYTCIFRGMSGSALYYMTGRQAQMLSKSLTEKNINSARPPRPKRQDDFIENEHTRTTLDKIFQDETPQTYNYLLEMYGEGVSSRVLYNTSGQKSRRWKNAKSFKSSMSLKMSQLKTKAKGMKNEC